MNPNEKAAEDIFPNKGMVNPYAMKKRIERDPIDEPLAETQKFMLIRQLNNYVLINKETKHSEIVSLHIASAILDLNSELQEMYTK